MLEAENLVKQFEKNEKKHKKVLFSADDHKRKADIGK